MAMRPTLIGSLRGNLQSVNLIWKKEKQTLERTMQYFDRSDTTVTLVWNARKEWYEGTTELSLGNHSGSLFISDQGVESTQEFQVDKQDIGVVQDILLFIDNTPAPFEHNVPVPTDISMAPTPETPLYDNEVPGLDSNLSDPARYSSGGDDLNEAIVSQTLKKENARLQIENGDLRAERQRIKNESYDLDSQVITALEKLSAYEQHHVLMQERYDSLDREARRMNETNQEMKLKIEAHVFQAARYDETIKQQQRDLVQYDENLKGMNQERDGLRARCNSLEQNHREIAKQGGHDQWRGEWQRGQETYEKSENIMQENINKLRDEDIPSLWKDKEELKQQLDKRNQQHQEELRLAGQERDALKYENEKLKENIYADGKKPIGQVAGAEDGGRDTILQMDQLTVHFEECSQSLRKLIQLLEANIEAKDSQLDRRSQELRDARMRNDKLVQEVLSRGNDINKLTAKLQQVLSTNQQMTSQTRISESESRSLDFTTADFENSPLKEDKIPVKFPLPSTADLIKYQPVVKDLYQDLEDTTNTTIDFNHTPVQVMKMVYLEDPKTHIENQVICMLHGSYSIGILKIVISHRPVPHGFGTLPPITYAGIQFNDPVGQSDGNFQGVQYFQTAPKCAEYVPLENVYIYV